MQSFSNASSVPAGQRHERGHLTYSEYINDATIVESLKPLAHHTGFPDRYTTDEVLFVRTHQAFEVWFHVIILELEETLRLLGQSAPSLPRDTSWDLPAWPRADLGSHQGALAEVIVKPVGELASPDVLRATLLAAAARLYRAQQALLHSIPFFDILATMTPRQFLAFRDRLSPASGFGSAQFREIELLLGLRHGVERKMAAGPDDHGGFAFALTQWGRERILRRYPQPSLRDATYSLLAAMLRECTGTRPSPLVRVVLGPDADGPPPSRSVRELLELLVSRQTPVGHGGAAQPLDIDAALAGLRTRDALDIHLLAAFVAVIESLGHHTPVRTFLHEAFELDKTLMYWRERHIRFVEQQIGIRIGTGGSTGVGYLRSTTATTHEHLSRALPCLWESRSWCQRLE